MAVDKVWHTSVEVRESNKRSVEAVTVELPAYVWEETLRMLVAFREVQRVVMEHELLSYQIATVEQALDTIEAALLKR